ncbi:hypothetical protein WME99_13675 [Sorangium sp. So ce136]|uniref:hypothetical protein n=1 Tax=Sorangium sp. So ce136 TaxID=3133284 RepID=UPI003F10E0CB
MDEPSAGGGGGEAGAPPVPNGEGGVDAGRDPLDEYEDPGCPDVEPITDFQCDPYDQSSGFCAPGEGCFIFVQYPNEPCGQEIYGAFCAPAGPGGQGDPCGGGGECGAGFACVVTGSGTQCVELCELSGDDHCSPGLVCEPIDVAGIGGCL